MGNENFLKLLRTIAYMILKTSGFNLWKYKNFYDCTYICTRVCACVCIHKCTHIYPPLYITCLCDYNLKFWNLNCLYLWGIVRFINDSYLLDYENKHSSLLSQKCVSYKLLSHCFAWYTHFTWYKVMCVWRIKSCLIERILKLIVIIISVKLLINIVDSLFFINKSCVPRHCV